MPILSTADSQRFLNFALFLADHARTLLRTVDLDHLAVSVKSDGSYVSEMDQRIESVWRENIMSQFPEHGLIGEEYPASGHTSPWQWVLDPIDGTDNFVHGIQTFGTLVSLRHEGRAVVGVIDHPRLDIRLAAAEGLGAYCHGRRLSISDQIELAPPIVAVTAPENFIQQGRMDALCAVQRQFPNVRIYRDCYAHSCVLQGQAAAMIECNARLWDVSAAEAINREAGGAFVRLDGPEDRYQVVFGKPAWVARLVNIMGTKSLSGA